MEQTLLDEGDDRRRQILQFIRDYLAEHRMGPSISEIATHTGMASKTAVRANMEALRRQGVITWSDGRFRSVRLTGMRLIQPHDDQPLQPGEETLDSVVAQWVESRTRLEDIVIELGNAMTEWSWLQQSLERALRARP